MRVFNLIDPEQSDCYNPFVYVREEKDVLSLIDNLIKNTTPRNASSNDPFWEKAEVALDSALMLYLIHEAPQDEQNFETMIYMMNFADVREEDEQYRSPLDMLFRALEEEQPAHVAVKQYKVFKQAAGKTAKSILVTAAVRLAAFNIPQYAAMTSMDEMDFGSLGERKRAIFCVIPVNDSSMNYLVGMLYTQCFQELYRRADLKYNGRLPVPVRVIQDEWANVAQPESYPKILATCRSYNIGLNIIVQNVQQIKALYEKEHESIIGNCDTLLFLGGGNEPASLEFIVKLLGRETLATRTRGLTKGRNGSSTTNYQQTGRDLMTVDEVRKLDTNKAILFIRGEDPVIDRKYNLKRHPNIKLTSDGKAKPYMGYYDSGLALTTVTTSLAWKPVLFGGTPEQKRLFCDLVLNGNNVKLIDFGLSDSDSHSVLKGSAGTQVYASPELISGGNVDYHTDIFSLGCVIDRLSPAYAKVARKCCQRDPSRRYQSALEVKEAIKHISRLPWGLAMAAILATILSVTLYLAHPGDVHERVSDVKAPYSDSSHSGTGKQSSALDVPARHIPDSSAKTQVKPSHSQSAASPKKPAKEASPARDPHSDRAAIDELFRQATELFDQ